MSYAIVNPKRHQQIDSAATLEEAKRKADEHMRRLLSTENTQIWVFKAGDYFTNREMGQILYRSMIGWDCEGIRS